MTLGFKWSTSKTFHLTIQYHRVVCLDFLKDMLQASRLKIMFHTFSRSAVWLSNKNQQKLSDIRSSQLHGNVSFLMLFQHVGWWVDWEMQSMYKVSAILPLNDRQTISDLFCCRKFRFEILETLETMAVVKLILVLSLLIIPALCLEIILFHYSSNMNNLVVVVRIIVLPHQDVSLFISKDNSQNDWMLNACGSCNFLNEMWLHC